MLAAGLFGQPCVTTNFLACDLNFDLPYSLDGAHCTVCLYAFKMMQAFIGINSQFLRSPLIQVNVYNDFTSGMVF